MEWFDFIKIREYDSPIPDDIPPGSFEIFQGTSGGGATIGDITATLMPANTLPQTPISDDDELAEEIWAGQNAKIDSEIKYCDQLRSELDNKQQQVNGWRDRLVDTVTEVLGEFFGDVVKAFTLGLTGSGVAAFIAGIATELGLEWGIDALVRLLTRGNELLAGIKDENALLLQLEKSRENYEYREAVLTRHREDIKIVLEQIRQAEKDVEIKGIFDIKALLERLTDLALRDDTVEMGDYKIHSRGKVIEIG